MTMTLQAYHLVLDITPGLKDIISELKESENIDLFHDLAGFVHWNRYFTT
jgi:hypothetical protein